MSETNTLPEPKTALSAAQRALLEKWMAGSLQNRQGLIPRRSHPDAAPLSFAQQRLWFLDQLEPGNAAYHMPAAVRLSGVLDVAALEQTLNRILGRHEVLRTTFSSVEGRPVQVIAPAGIISLPVVDLCELPEAERETRGQQWAAEEFRRPFDLAQGPLLRAVLLRLHGREHILLLTMHHIISDGWSVGILIREMTGAYQSLAAGGPVALPELPIQYADFAEWQRQWLQGEVLADQLAYWKRHLANLPVLELPTDWPRPRVQTFRGLRRSLKIPLPLTEKLQTLSRRMQATLFTTLLAAFKLLLWRHTGQTDIVVGTPIAGRNRTETENLIGFFINTLVLRTDLAGPLTFRGLLERVRETTLEAYARQDLPFEKLVEELEPQRDLSRTPLFQVFFNMLNVPQAPLELQDLRIEPFLGHDRIDSKFDITVYAEEQNDGLRLELVYNADLYHPDHMAEFLDQFQLLLAQIAEEPGKDIGAYELITPRAKQYLPDPVSVLNPSRDQSVPKRFSRSAQQFPEHLAVVDADGQWTYRELETRSNRLAHYLRMNGIRSQAIVAIYAHRSTPLVWALLGILKAGAAFMILDPAYPPARLSACLEKARPKALLWIEAAGALPEFLRSFAAQGSCRCSLGLPPLSAAAEDFLTDCPAGAPLLKIRPDDLAYVVFTSGTTGLPKGILGTHRPLGHFLQWHIRTFGLTRHDRFSMLSGLSHDPLLRDIFTPLCLGATLHIPGPERLGSPDLGRWMEQEKVSVSHLTPAMGQLLYGTCKAGILSSLRYAFFGGDILTQTDLSRFRTIAPSAICVNLYGATETPQAMGYFIAASAQTPAAGNSAAERPKEVMPLGQGIGGVQLLVLNPARRLAGIGEVGEIHIRTPYLAKGYLDDEILTQERFPINPFTRQTGDRLYRSGDRGRYMPDGKVEFLGRADLQVKIRGFRVELEEIEAALSAHPNIREAVVAIHQDPAAQLNELIAYIVPRSEPSLSISGMRRFLRNKLPDYMIPSVLVRLEAIPLTPNGKADRRILASAGGERIGSGQAPVLPRNPTEELLFGMWNEVLRPDRMDAQADFGIHHDFFEIGGHSLLATLLLSRIRDAFQIELPLRLLFEEPTIAGLALKIETALRGDRDLPRQPIRPDPHPEKRELSFAQQRLWFLDQLEPGNPFYTVSIAVRLNGPLDIRALERSLNTVVQRHAALRTAFHNDQGRPLLDIAPALSIPLSVADLGELPRSEHESYASRSALQLFQAPFDLARPPLLRTMLLRFDPAEHALVLTMHHIVSDAWSLGVLIRELTAIYQDDLAGRPCSLPDLPVQYTDFAAWQRDWLQGAILESQLAFWKQRLYGDLTPLALPFDRPRPAIQTYRGAHYASALAPQWSPALHRLCRRERATLFMLLLAAFKILLYRYTEQSDVVVGTPIANRNQSAIEGLIGFFVNTLALRTDLSGNPTVRELLGRVRDTTLGAYAHQDLPFEMLVDALQPVRDMGRSPLFQTAFTLQNVPMPDLKLPDLTIRPVEFETGIAKFDLVLSMSETPHGLLEIWEYNTDLFDVITIQRLARNFQTLLESIIADPDKRLSDLSILTREELQQLLTAWNDTGTGDLRHPSFVEWFELHAEQRPDAVAAVSQEGHLTYRELNRCANRLAHHLLGLGLEPEELVGLCMDRSLEMAVGFLGILKSGGGYVPLNPTYPMERLAFMVEDTRLRVVLTKKQTLPRLSGMNANKICMDADWECIAREPDHRPFIQVAPANLAYMIYTSGSTGMPKGVLVEHRGLINLAETQAGFFNLGSGDRILLFASLSFDASIFEMVMAWQAGAVLCLPTRDSILIGQDLVDLLRNWSITCLTLTPSALMASPAESLPALSIINMAGEAFPADLAETWSRGRRLFNLYGPTENTVWTTAAECDDGRRKPSIGRPIANTQIYILDSYLHALPIGGPGELYIGGIGLSRGYLNQPDLTAARFIPDPFGSRTGARLYQTGDRARYLADGNIEFLGRADAQVKIRGFRIELGEIETVLGRHPSVQEAVVLTREIPRAAEKEGSAGDKRLVAYVVPRPAQSPAADALRDFLKEKLPEYMIPAAFVMLDALPLTPHGKVDRRALPAPDFTHSKPGAAYVAPQSKSERAIAQIWQEVLGIEHVGLNDNFFDLGGHSLLVAQVHQRLKNVFHKEIPITDMFKYTTIAALAQYLDPNEGQNDLLLQKAAERVRARQETETAADIAIIGMRARFPGAANLDQFWENLRRGVESITFFSDEELIAAGTNPEWLKHPDFVKARAVLTGIDCFDANFFGINPREAELMDPQQRLFLEQAWLVLEDAGCDPEQFQGRIALFAGAADSNYLRNNLYPNRDFERTTNVMQVGISNTNDFLATQVSYKLNLTGPSVTVRTACSTSLVAVHEACQSLLRYECDLALAGGISLKIPQESGYFYTPGGIVSPDGHCRPFDAKAQGTLGANGLGLVVFKRLAEAIRDGDTIRAVIKGSAINNDGARKIGYTAPSEDGQAEVIAEALAVAKLDAGAIGYVEAHGTATAVGDPIEVAALSRVFRASTQARQFCALGSVKSNFGHLDIASGMAGLIKTVLALQHKQIPPSLHFNEPNPKIDFSSSPFYVNTRLQDWTVPEGQLRRAGVSCFGIGGTNVHAVLEEAPEIPADEARRPSHLLLLSAKTAAALDQVTVNLCEHLEKYPEINLADAAYTLQTGRKSFEHRRMLVCQGRTDALQTLKTRDPARLFSAVQASQKRTLAFMFPGVGDHNPQMARGLYQTEPLFAETVNGCCDLLRPLLDLDLLDILYPPSADASPSPDFHRQRPEIAQASVFVVEYALAALLRSWGLIPDALLGYGLGEYTAACLSGVFSLADALTLIVQRSRLFQRLPAGGILAVKASEMELQPFLSDAVYLAGVNGPNDCILCGLLPELKQLVHPLTEKGIACRLTETGHVLHPPLRDGLMEEFTAALQSVRLHPPQIPYLSNVTGDWIAATEAADPAYWARHLCCTVRFAEGLEKLLTERHRVLLEVGPGQSLSALVGQHPLCPQEQLAQTMPTLPNAGDGRSDVAFLLNMLGKLWLAGLSPDWRGFYGDERRRRIPLPGYPFARDRYWIEPPKTEKNQDLPLARHPDPEEWFYLPSWKPAAVPAPAADASSWLIFSNNDPSAEELATRLQAAGHQLHRARAGAGYDPSAAPHYVIDPRQNQDFLKLITALEPLPRHILYWVNEVFDLYALLFLVQALARRDLRGVKLTLMTSQAQHVLNGEGAAADQALVLGLVLVASQEYPELSCRGIDLVVPSHPGLRARFYSNLLAELAAPVAEPWVAYRNGARWVPAYHRVPPPPLEPHSLREKGVYWITGGMGRIGRTIARHLAETLHARLVLIGRSALPPCQEWKHWLETHETIDPVSDKIRFIQTLEEQGAEVLVIAADVAEREQMQAAVERTYQRFGALHGVLHMAGILGADIFVPIQGLTKAIYELQLRPKVQGTRVLAEVLRDQNLDFCLLFSSISSLLGGLGFAAYAAANRFMDAFAEQQNRMQATPWLSIDWDVWRFPDQEKTSPAGADLAELGLLPDEGIQAFEKALRFGGLTPLIVSTGDLEKRLKRWVWRSSAADARREPEIAPLNRHPRPDLKNPYAAPRNDIESQMVAIWEELLGVTQVGVHDHFMDLGGHSLLATQLLSRVRSTFHVELPMDRFFESPTIAELALDIIRLQLGDSVDEQVLKDMLAEAETLNEESLRS